MDKPIEFLPNDFEFVNDNKATMIDEVYSGESLENDHSSDLEK